MKDFFKKLTLLGLFVAVLGIFALVTGIVPVKASSGHWPITHWILDFASDRSISTHSAGIEVPMLDEPGMLTLGAGTYQSNCQWCHGRPGSVQPRATSRMTPAPPFLPDVVDHWETHQLFYIVKHGIKFTGMPAWPTEQRDDEIWPLVAFLKQAGGMSAQSYDELLAVEENTDAPEIVIEACAVCHADDGSGCGSARVPILAGQNEAYLRDSLRAFARGNRHSGVMEPIAARLDDDEIDDVAQWYASQAPPAGPQPDLDDKEVQAGRELLSQQDDTLKIAVCSDCHGESNDPAYPILAGQPAEYLDRQLRLFRERTRGGSDSGNLMHKISDAINERQSKQLASYFASLHRDPPTSRDD
ncbi:Cytochrome c-552 precursor [Stieleria maiorica]|uniref:Cytochrome c-552 n=1 Tax=Stieleria maiorica TaxID=2795974 RepID=A0A5B9MNS3_9BACT|nr:c-type cytochrome [Stieleria maiorica]QEG01315.1 Cytochrome c-552 precursor [Stieleria maiorica]